MSFGKRFGALVAARRQLRQLTLKGLARQAFGEERESAASEISKLENGFVNRPQAKTVARLAKALDISESEILILKSDQSIDLDREAAAESPRNAGAFLKVVGGPGFVPDMTSSHRILEKLVALDYASLEGLAQDHAGTPTQWAPIFLYNMDCWKVILDAFGSIVGYWMFLPLSDSLHEKMQRGKLRDSEITIDQIKTLSAPGHYHVYFVMLCLTPPLRNAHGIQKLITSFCDTLNNLSKSGIFIESVHAHAFSAHGRQICEHLRMNAVAKHEYGGNIYKIDTSSLLGRLNITSRHFKGRYRDLNAYYR